MGVKSLVKQSDTFNPKVQKHRYAKRDTKEHKKGKRTNKHKGGSQTVNIRHLGKIAGMRTPRELKNVIAKAATMTELRQRGNLRDSEDADEDEAMAV